jgi:cytochrome P450
LHGKRICLGKTLAEMELKSLLTMILINLDFEFVDKTNYTKRIPFLSVNEDIDI